MKFTHILWNYIEIQYKFYIKFYDILHTWYAFLQKFYRHLHQFYSNSITFYRNSGIFLEQSKEIRYKFWNILRTIHRHSIDIVEYSYTRPYKFYRQYTSIIEIQYEDSTCLIQVIRHSIYMLYVSFTYQRNI